METSGGGGANTFRDPRYPSGQSQRIPPRTAVPVGCRLLAPSLASVSPDGYWYLLTSGTWKGLWAAANSFLNGDRPGGTTLQNTDWTVPLCR